MAYELMLMVDGIPRETMPSALESHGIQLNDYARIYMNHRDFQSGTTPHPVRMMVISLEELGLKNGATFPQIMDAAQKRGLHPCAPAAGVYLRLNLTKQKVSQNSILTGTHEAPEGAITVISRLLETDCSFPRGLYLRNVDGALWLRGYTCDDEYRWKPADVFAFEIK